MGAGYLHQMTERSPLEKGKSAERFITAIHYAPDNCELFTIKNQQIRDHIIVRIRDHLIVRIRDQLIVRIRDHLIVRIRDHSLSEHLKIEAELTLEKT